MIYDQYNLSGNFFVPSSAAQDTDLADDFVVPDGQTWTISGIDALGYTTGTVASFNIAFYTNAAGDLPGSTLAALSGSFVQTPTANPPVERLRHHPQRPACPGARDLLGRGPGRRIEQLLGLGESLVDVEQRRGVRTSPGPDCATWTRRTSCIASDPNPDEVFR